MRPVLRPQVRSRGRLGVPGQGMVLPVGSWCAGRNGQLVRGQEWTAGVQADTGSWSAGRIGQLVRGQERATLPQPPGAGRALQAGLSVLLAVQASSPGADAHGFCTPQHLLLLSTNPPALCSPEEMTCEVLHYSWLNEGLLFPSPPADQVLILFL